MLEDYIGTIQAFGFNFPPKGWAFCDGQIIAITTNTALFSLIGTTFGGDGRTTFGLPDLRSRTIVHAGAGPGLTPVAYGEKGGRDTVTLLTSNMPAHNHSIVNGMATVHTTTTVNVGAGGVVNESGQGEFALSSGGQTPNIYSENPAGQDYVAGVTSVSTISGTTAAAGANIPVNIRSPYLGVYVSICMYGVFPSRS